VSEERKGNGKNESFSGGSCNFDRHCFFHCLLVFVVIGIGFDEASGLIVLVLDSRFRGNDRECAGTTEGQLSLYYNLSTPCFLCVLFTRKCP